MCRGDTTSALNFGTLVDMSADTTTKTTNYFVQIKLLDVETVRNEANLDLDPTFVRGPGAAGAFRTQMGYGRYNALQGRGLFRIEATTPEEAAEVAFGIFNSYVLTDEQRAQYPGLRDELHFDAEAHPQYLDYVRGYRDRGNRSLSVGDWVTVRAIGGPTVDFGVAGAGFTLIKRVEVTYTDDAVVTTTTEPR